MSGRYYRHLGPVLLAQLLTICALSVGLFAEARPCRCPKIECNLDCEYQQGSDFYTFACGPKGKRVSSCQKPRCFPLDEAPPQCRKAKKKVQRKTASAKSQVRPKESPVIGQVQSIRGKAYVLRANGKERIRRRGFKLKLADTVLTDARGRLVIVLMNKSLVQVSPHTRLEMFKYGEATGESKETLLRLFYGKVRSRVENAKGSTPSQYKIKTPSAVAGVRGTDFVTTVDATLSTFVETLQGQVSLKGHGEKRSVMVSQGERSAYLTQRRPVQSLNSWMELESAGELSPIEKMSAEELKQLDQETLIQIEEKISAKVHKAPICQEPPGHFNQCWWQCEGVSGSKGNCPTNRPGVQCVRRRCVASGQWKEAYTLSPELGRRKCRIDQKVVKPCDY